MVLAHDDLSTQSLAQIPSHGQLKESPPRPPRSISSVAFRFSAPPIAQQNTTSPTRNPDQRNASVPGRPVWSRAPRHWSPSPVVKARLESNRGETREFRPVVHGLEPQPALRPGNSDFDQQRGTLTAATQPPPQIHPPKDDRRKKRSPQFSSEFSPRGPRGARVYTAGCARPFYPG